MIDAWEESKARSEVRFLELRSQIIDGTESLWNGAISDAFWHLNWWSALELVTQMEKIVVEMKESEQKFSAFVLEKEGE